MFLRIFSMSASVCVVESFFVLVSALTLAGLLSGPESLDTLVPLF